MLAAVGSGVLALSLLQFSVDAFPQLEEGGGTLVARAIRTAFFAFIGTAAALLVAYLSGVWRSARLALAFNIYGAIAFVAAAFLAGGFVGGALRMLAGERGGLPPSVALFFLFNIAAVVTLAVAALVSAAARLKGQVRVRRR